MFKATIRRLSTGPLMSWTDYFKLKKQNNITNIVTSVCTGVLGGAATLTYLGNIEIDVEKSIMGFDPIMVMGGIVIIGGGLGWLVGPIVGNPIFRAVHRSKLPQFNAMNKVFLQRVKLNRVDASLQSFSNPVPDYYGERIYSLASYKQWLRDCNAYRRKAKEFI